MSGTGQTRHGEGPIFLSTHLSDDNGGFHSRVKNYITQSRFSLFSLLFKDTTEDPKKAEQ